MAPPTPVYTRAEIESQYSHIFNNLARYECHLKSITQHECTFKLSEDNSYPSEIICLPFKRLFQRCLEKTIVKENGKKKPIDKWINIEVTDPDTNRDMLEDPKYAKDVRDFRKAEHELHEWMNSEDSKT